MKKFINILICLTFVASCSYSVPIRPTVSPIAYEFTEKKIESNVAIFVHGDPAKLNQVVSPKSLAGSACSYSVEVGNSLKKSLVKIANSYFTNVTPIDHLPKDKTSFDGILTAELIDFNIDITFPWPGFIARASAEMRVKLTFYDSDLKLVWTSVVEYSNLVVAQAGTGCDDGVEPISSAIETCFENLTLQMAIKISKSEKIKETLKVGR
jgi:hypothetical protein